MNSSIQLVFAAALICLLYYAIKIELTRAPDFKKLARYRLLVRTHYPSHSSVTAVRAHIYARHLIEDGYSPAQAITQLKADFAAGRPYFYKSNCKATHV